MKSIKKSYLIIGAILLIVILMNPSINRFKEFSGLIGKDSKYITKPYNFLIFSVYKNERTDKFYAGFLLNFIDITKENKTAVTYSQGYDSVATAALPQTIKEVDNTFFEAADTAYAVKEKKYITPNGRIVIESKLKSFYGNRFDKLLSEGIFKLVDYPKRRTSAYKEVMADSNSISK